MQIKAIKPINFLFFRTLTTIQDLATFLPVGQNLFREAVANNLTITGPIHWHYFGFHGDVKEPFVLEIALPVGEVIDEYDGEFHFKRTESFKCVSLVHDGKWHDMPGSYGKIMEYLAECKLQPNAANREIYVNADFRYPEANVTEIQVGIN